MSPISLGFVLLLIALAGYVSLGKESMVLAFLATLPALVLGVVFIAIGLKIV